MNKNEYIEYLIKTIEYLKRTLDKSYENIITCEIEDVDLRQKIKDILNDPMNYREYEKIVFEIEKLIYESVVEE